MLQNTLNIANEAITPSMQHALTGLALDGERYVSFRNLASTRGMYSDMLCNSGLVEIKRMDNSGTWYQLTEKGKYIVAILHAQTV